MGVGIGVLLGSLITTRREREHYVWQQRCELYMELLTRGQEIMYIALGIAEAKQAPELLMDDRLRALCEVFASDEMDQVAGQFARDSFAFRRVVKAAQEAREQGADVAEHEQLFSSARDAVLVDYALLLEQVNVDLGTRKLPEHRRRWPRIKARVRRALSIQAWT